MIQKISSSPSAESSVAHVGEGVDPGTAASFASAAAFFRNVRVSRMRPGTSLNLRL
jgi:hypothetical protein